MDSTFSMGGLIPLWILGAPFLIGLVSLFTTPKHVRSDQRDQRTAPPPYNPLPPAGLAPQRM